MLPALLGEKIFPVGRLLNTYYRVCCGYFDSNTYLLQQQNFR